MRVVVAVVGDEPVDAANYNLNNCEIARESETMGNCLFVCIARRRRRRRPLNLQLYWTQVWTDEPKKALKKETAIVAGAEIDCDSLCRRC